MSLKPKQPKTKLSKIKLPTARSLLTALGEHVENLRPSFNPKPKEEQIHAARITATVSNSCMNIVRTSMQAEKIAGKKLSLLQLGE